MQYKIHTSPILDAFKDPEPCPLCRITQELSKNWVERFLGSAVMEPHMRGMVNASGFCHKHFNDLLAGNNILGVALQQSTRIDYLLDNMPMPKNKKEAKKHAQRAITESFSCVICNETHVALERYYITTAQLYHDEPEFQRMLQKCKGLCMFHYGKLMYYAPYARSHANSYIQTLYRIHSTHFCSLRSELTTFCNKFDYQKKDLPWGNSKDAPIRAAKVLTKQKE